MRKKYKSQGDIPYLKFMQFGLEIKDHETDEELIAEKVIDYFYKGTNRNHAECLIEFNAAIQKPSRFPSLYRLDLKRLDRTDNFIDSENFRSDNDFESLLKIITRNWYWFGKVNVHKISVAKGNSIMQSFQKELSKLSNLINTSLIHH